MGNYIPETEVNAHAYLIYLPYNEQIKQNTWWDK